MASLDETLKQKEIQDDKVEDKEKLPPILVGFSPEQNKFRIICYISHKSDEVRYCLWDHPQREHLGLALACQYCSVHHGLWAIQDRMLYTAWKGFIYEDSEQDIDRLSKGTISRSE